VVDHLERNGPGIRDRLCEPGPTLRGHIHIYVNRERAKLETPLAEQSRVDVIAAISGG
jgi:molybdopterin converting factor small subunit